MTTVADGLYQYGGMPVISGMPVPFTGKWWWVDPLGGLDGNSGSKPSDAFQTLYMAHNQAVAGRNDVVALISNGASTSSARLSLALAQTVTPAATAGTLVWSKNATHLIGVCSPTYTAQRARIAPPTGTYTQATFGSGNFVTVTAAGCYFANFSLFNGFSTGGTNQICWTDSGQRNAYVNVEFGGMADAASANDAGSRSLKVGGAGNGENSFFRCTIGLDTVARTAANSALEFTGGTPRNRFTECVFPSFLTGSGANGFAILGTGNSCVDRFNLFERCVFVSSIKSGGSLAMATLGSFTTAAPGGLVLLKDCDAVGMTAVGDANFLANSYVTNLYGTTTTMHDVNPS